MAVEDCASRMSFEPALHLAIAAHLPLVIYVEGDPLQWYANESCEPVAEAERKSGSHYLYISLFRLVQVRLCFP